MPCSLEQWLADANGAPTAELEHLLMARLGLSRSQLLLNPEQSLEPAQLRQLNQDLGRLRSGEPLAYLLGTQPFRDLELAVDKRVLVPRSETELLVDAVLEHLDARPQPHSIIDLGTGSGAIGIALAVTLAARTEARISATDLSADALVVAQRNAERANVTVQLLQADWYTGLTERYSVIVSNPPYIAASDAHLPALQHEPQSALVSGPDGLQALRVIIAGAVAHLLPQGALFVEHGFDQGAAVRELFANAGFTQIQTRKDLAGHDRFCSGLLEESP